MKEYTNKGKCKPTEDKKTRKHRNKITLLVICLYVMAVVSLILHIGILIGLASSIGALIGFALSAISLSPIVGGVVSSVSMLSAFCVIKKIRSHCFNHYVDLVMAPNVNDCIKGSLATIGCSQPVITSIEICVYFGIGSWLVALGVKSPAAIGALTGTIISAVYVSWICVDKVIEYFDSREVEQPDSDVTSTESKNYEIDDSLQLN